ncbi:MAG: type II secretion system protein GspG [Candidatus Thermoplasmatota archaeon]
MKKNTGFTLIELLMVIALLAVLSILGFPMFQGSQKRSRDSRRKTDLQQITKALEMYANDTGSYPSSSGGKIVGCTGTLATSCSWGSAWVRNTTYMQKLPKDPSSGVSYCYEKASKYYKLYAKIERTDDPDYDEKLSCGGAPYTYVLLSPNITPTPKP